MSSEMLDPSALAERAAIVRLLQMEADQYTASGDRADLEGDDRNCYAMRAVAANLRRLASWIEEGEQHKQ